jgi:hypothetical protein
MRSRLWLNIALLAVVAILGLLAYFLPEDKELEHRLSALTPPEAQRIHIEWANARSATLVREAPHWTISAPFTARADGFQVERLLSILDATAKQPLAAIGAARYGLHHPAASMTINQQTFNFGAINEISRERYIQTKGAIYPVPLRYANIVPKDALQLVAKQLFAPGETLVALEFDGYKVAREAGRWRATPAIDASADDLQRWLDEWRLASALSAVAADERKALTTIKIGLQDGPPLTIEVLQREPDLVLKRSDLAYALQFAQPVGKRLLMPPHALK